MVFHFGVPMRSSMGAVVVALAGLVSVSTAHAAYTINAVESGGSVVFNSQAGGSLNMAAWGAPVATNIEHGTFGGTSTVNVARTTLAGERHDLTSLPNGSFSDQYSGAAIAAPTGWIDLGSNTTLDPSDSSGIPFLFTVFTNPSFASRIRVPAGYVSGATLGTLSFSAPGTFASLTLNPGSYAWTWAGGTASEDSVILNIGVPEPASLALLGLGGLTMLRRRTA
jgi:FlaG/FlaF family flagellin (archaellin)